jgi:hypothetical protein
MNGLFLLAFLLNAEIRGTRVPRGTAIQSSAGSCVPMSWNRSAEITQTTDCGDGCSGDGEVAVLGRSFRLWQAIASRTDLFERADLAIQVSALVWMP